MNLEQAQMKVEAYKLANGTHRADGPSVGEVLTEAKSIYEWLAEEDDGSQRKA